MPAARRGWARSSAGERGERGAVGVGVGVGRMLVIGGSGLSRLVGERGGEERFANGSVSRRSL